MPRPSSSSSTGSTDSYTSILSDDSYLSPLEAGTDDLFKKFLNDVKMIENNRSVSKERKIQSHEAKKRDPNDVGTRCDWTPQMQSDYASYKTKVSLISLARKTQIASAKAARAAMESKNIDLATLEEYHNAALEDAEKWQHAAMVAATERLGFMTKYPNAFNTLSTKNHIIAAQHNLDSVKLALRVVQAQKKKIADAKSNALKQAGSSSKHTK
ncbi:hypothetical protein GGR58DRAFT_518297 [Xylaria digitata]|nr:hypothetical protein GGR58DRAFT_518297 [Xylaria digitata]